MHLDGADAASAETSRGNQMDLFAEPEMARQEQVLKTDTGRDILKPSPINEYPPVNYLKLAEEGEK